MAALFGIVLLTSSITAADPVVCVNPNSDPDGDRWGWENGQSCLVVSKPAYPPCSNANFDSDGDGWGWENGRTCLVTVDNPDPDIIDKTPYDQQPQIGRIVLSYNDYPYNLAISSSGNIYFFQPTKNHLAAMDHTGNFLWQKKLENQYFADSVQLDPSETQLVLGLNGGGLGVYDLSGNQLWVTPLDNYLAPQVSLGDTAIIADYHGSVPNTKRQKVTSYNYDGTLRWEYQVDRYPGEVKLGKDGNVYIRAKSTEFDDSEEVLIYRQ